MDNQSKTMSKSALTDEQSVENIISSYASVTWQGGGEGAL
jgi:hypothetical protein